MRPAKKVKLQFKKQLQLAPAYGQATYNISSLSMVPACRCWQHWRHGLPQNQCGGHQWQRCFPVPGRVHNEGARWRHLEGKFVSQVGAMVNHIGMSDGEFQMSQAIIKGANRTINRTLPTQQTCVTVGSGKIRQLQEI